MHSLDERLTLDVCANIVLADSLPQLRAYVVTLATLFRGDPRWPALALIASEARNDG